MTAPDDLGTAEGTPTDDDLHGAAEEVKEGLQGDSDDDESAPTPGGG